MNYTLRPYQEQALASIPETGAYLICLATGLGKTVCMSKIPRKGRMLIISHRNELVHQPEKYFDCSFGVEQGEVQLDRVAFKQILDAYLLDLLETQVAVQPARHWRHLEHFHVVRQSQLRDFLNLGIGDFLDGNDKEGDVVVAKELLQMLELEHGQRLQLHSDFVLILVKESQHIVFGGVVAVDGALGGDTRRARAENNDVLAPLGGVHRLQIIKFEGETVEYQEHHRDEKLHHQHGGGH